MTQLADIIIFNAAILTMDAAQPHANAIAMANGQILAVGSKDSLHHLAGPSTRQIDAQGHSVVPGINESHIHVFGGSAVLNRLSLFNKNGLEAITTVIQAHAAQHRTEPLLIVNSTDYTVLGEGRSLDRHILDGILPDQPLALMSPDFHTVWANTIALKKADLLHGRQLAPGNEVVIGPDGLATGELRESGAFNPVIALDASGGRDRLGVSADDEPQGGVSSQEREYDKALLRNGLKHLARHGITSFQNMDGNFYQLQLLAEIEKEGDLLCRARIPLHCVSGGGAERMKKAVAMRSEYHSRWLTSGTVKFFLDGVIDSHTALMAQDYADQPGWRGEPRFDLENFKTLCIEADKRGLQIAVHSIGDGSTKAVLDAYEAVRAANGKCDSRHRIEHLELVRDADFARLKALSVIASMQPPHPPGQCGLPLEPTISAIGQQHWPRAYAWRRIRDLGIPLAFSSDWPVSSVNPWESIHSAVTRKPWAVGLPDNRQTVAEALQSYTLTGAYAEFAENWKGMLKSGYVADLVILDRNIENCDPEELAEVMPVLTMCGGRVTFEA
ncbi:amidohydrolase [Aestuariivirga litoralis]|uniref:amidohydrolase n=1 Tax=Aestuariivirga litoralis TaxID=2650924 RepID=UPI0018C85557|nr:amidohydrolase [Aestuariivirga litoralis]MBG1232376.1 amidohydrolase [Aestuariivirga litoralis]